MWLLSAARAELKFFNDPTDVPHPGICILSHTWGTLEEEQTFQQIQEIGKECKAAGENPRKSEKLSSKIRKCCELAEEHGYEWVWIDTCCINKESSSELSEAINSMFRYYSLSSVCYVYLSDVPLDTSGCDTFRDSRWHKRGWTLQELIAPSNLLFFSRAWTFLGTKADLAEPLEKVTGVPVALLRGGTKLSSYSVAQRMSWAANRETSRKEDEAYCLLGIFDISMPTLYGEGAKAFHRLQKMILQESADTTIFAWNLGYYSDMKFMGELKNDPPSPLLAESPREFSDSGSITFGSGSMPEYHNETSSYFYKTPAAFTVTPHGILARVPSAMVNGVKLIDLDWHLRCYHSGLFDRVYPVLVPCGNTGDGPILWYIPHAGTRRRRGLSANKITSGRGITALRSKTPIDADWTVQDLYILDSRNENNSVPGPPFPCNSSAKSPFHFRISQSEKLSITNVFNAGIDWTGKGPAVLELKQGDTQVHLTFGICTRHTDEKSWKSRALVKHWIRACFGLYERCSSCRNDSSHVCHNDHIGEKGLWKNYSLEAQQVLDKFSSQHIITYSMELHLRQHPWAENTVIVDSIHTLTPILSLKQPLIYALDPKTNRVLSHTDGPFPLHIAGPPIAENIGSVYLGSAVLDCGETVRPCTIVMQDGTPKVLACDNLGMRFQHYGYYYLLAFDRERMCWVSSTQDVSSLWDQCPVIAGSRDGRTAFHARFIGRFKGSNDHYLGYFEEDEEESLAVIDCDGDPRWVPKFDVLCWKKNEQIFSLSERVEHVEESTSSCHENVIVSKSK